MQRQGSKARRAETQKELNMVNNKPDEGSLRLRDNNKDSNATSVNHTTRYIKLNNNPEEHRLVLC